MRNLIRGFIALAFSGAVAAPALAGIADTPLPVLELKVSTQHLYSVPDVVNTPTLGTYFSCTSTSSSSMWVSVELFDAMGTPANSALLDEHQLGAGASVRFGTGFALGIDIGAFLGANGFPVGSARIVATSKSLICSVFVADRTKNPPAIIYPLTIIAKTKQKAAN
jgi:hypothetical protein